MAGLLLSIVAFRFVNPPITSVMMAEKLKGATLKHRWVPLETIARDLPLAVIASEDGRFCVHWGVDWGAVKDAVEEAKRRHRSFRGASTIPMQTAKNLYLCDRPELCAQGARSAARLSAHPVLAERARDRGLSQHRAMGPRHLRRRGGEPALFSQERVASSPGARRCCSRRRCRTRCCAIPASRARRMLRIAKSVERRMPILAARSSCVVPQINRQSASGQRRG